MAFSQAKAALGFFKFLGASFTKQSYEFHEKFDFTFDGNPFFEDEKIDISETIISLGAAIPLASSTFGEVDTQVDTLSYGVSLGYSW